MKKISLSVIAAAMLILSSCVYDTGESHSSSGPKVNTLSVSDIQFNSSTYILSANVNVTDGTQVSLECNGRIESAVAAGGKISLVFSSPFYAGIKGGKPYNVEFAVEGYSRGEGTIEYWPTVSYELDSPDEIMIYNGGADDYVIPEFTLKNYNADKVTYEKWFKVFKTEGYNNPDTRDEIAIDTKAWQYADMIAFLKDRNNDGKTLEAHFSITPKCTDGDKLTADGYVIYHCKKDVLVKSAFIDNHSGRFVVHLYADDIPSDESEAETAGGVVSYQWYVSDDAVAWNIITGANGKSFSLTKDNESKLIGRTLKVQLIQTFEGEVKPTIDSPTYPIRHTVKTAELYYDGTLKVGEQFDTSKIKGTIIDELGNQYTETDFHFITIDDLEFDASDDNTGYYKGSVSKSFAFSCRQDSFYDAIEEVFVTVQAGFTESEIPHFAAYTELIKLGSAVFETIDKTLEISLEDDGATYSDLPEGEFSVKAGQILYIRRKSSGTPNTEGYIKASDPLTVTVSQDNIGKRIDGNSIIDEIQIPSLKLNMTTSNGTTTIKPELNYTESYWEYEYTWLIDGVDALSYSGAVSDSTHALIITNSAFAKDSYQIFCKVRMYVTDENDSSEIDLTAVSAQTTLVVK